MAPPLNIPLAVFTTLLLAIPLLTLRLLSILPPYRPPPRPRKRGTPTRILIILGSGGHTAEMFALLRDLNPTCYTHRSYIVSSGDNFSADKAREFEAALAVRWQGRQQSAKGAEVGDDIHNNANGSTKETVEPTAMLGKDWNITTIPRARRVHQSLLSTPFTSLQCLRACFSVLRYRPSPSSVHTHVQEYPDLIITNGPGTAVVLILASIILRLFDIDGANRSGKMRTIYVESWARVRRLSLSGKLLVRVVDRFVVQWEGLKGVGGKGEFLGGPLV